MPIDDGLSDLTCGDALYAMPINSALQGGESTISYLQGFSPEYEPRNSTIRTKVRLIL
jgi:hypothetical protein